jgi:taurine dioxygenase
MTIYTLMPLHESLGLAVIGLDLAAPIDAETTENFGRLLAEHLVLVFPEQSLTPDQYLAASRLFGPPLRPDYSQQLMPGYPDIGLVTHPDGRGAPDVSHTNREPPPAATLLYGVEIPSSGAGTSIADMRAAYWGLPDDERARLETMRMVNRSGPDRPEDPAQFGTPVVHPMVRTHPVSRERSLYLDPDRTAQIEGMTPQASRDYLDDLQARMIQPEIVYHHQWAKGDVLVIDERATLHRVQDDYDAAGPRVLWRIIVDGDQPKS